MKTFFYNLSSGLVIFLIVLTLSSCEKDTEKDASLKLSPEKQVLKQVTLLGNEINLPIGTAWYYNNREKNEVAFELPKGYQFLLHNTLTGEFKVANDGGGYSCTCSSGGSCTTFYNADLGYGCLQSTCGGSCTGKNGRVKSNEVIEGVLYTANDMVDSDTVKRASLSEIGKKGIFKVAAFRNEIKRTYDLVYKHVDKPDFSNPNFEKNLNNDKFVFAKTYLFGFEIGLIIPNDANLGKLMTNLQRVEAPKKCDCGGSGSGCDLKKEGLFGYVAYYCTGCTTCTMN